MENQLKELLRRKFDEEISKVGTDANSSSMDHLLALAKPTANKDAESMVIQESDYRPVSAMISHSQRQNLIQFALPENKNMR